MLLQSPEKPAVRRLTRLLKRFRPAIPRRYGLKPLRVTTAEDLRLPLASVKARERLLLFVALDGAPEGLDPIRLQKGMFLFAQDEVSREDERYQFVPYNYGPMSAQIYKDLERLESEGHVEAISVEGQSWARYVATENGLIHARDLLKQEKSEEVARRLHAIKRDVASKTFSALLDDVYDRYPAYAAKSIFKRVS
jgi:uncharacterized protein YwgA